MDINYLFELVTCFIICIFGLHSFRFYNVFAKIFGVMVITSCIVTFSSTKAPYFSALFPVAVLFVYRDYLIKGFWYLINFIKSTLNIIFRIVFFFQEKFTVNTSANNQSYDNNNQSYSNNDDTNRAKEEAERAKERMRQAREETRRKKEEENNQKERTEKPDNRTDRQILRLPSSGILTKSALSKAWKQSLDRYHVDKHQQMSEEFKKEAEKEVIKINNAYRRLLSELC